MAINIRSIISQAYDLAKISSGEFNDSIDGIRADTAVAQLNQIIAQLNTSALFPFTRTVVNYQVLVSQQEYTIGIDYDNTVPLVADIVAERPEFVERLYYKSNASAYPIDVCMIDYPDLLGRITSTASGMPNVFATDNGYPLLKLVFDLKPLAGSTLQIAFTKSIPSFTIDSVLAIDVRYAAVIVPALARYLALNQPQEILSGIDILYKENMKQLKNANLRAQIPLTNVPMSSEGYIYQKMASFQSGY